MANELILIVEDNDKNMKLARDILQVKGYRTLEAESAEAGQRAVVVCLEAERALREGCEVPLSWA